MKRSKTSEIVIISVCLIILISCVVFLVTIFGGGKSNKDGSKPEEKVEKLTPFNGDIDSEDVKKTFSVIEQFDDYGSPASTVIESESSETGNTGNQNPKNEAPKTETSQNENP